MPRSCVPDIDVMDPQALDPVDMDGKCVNPHEAVKEALTTKTAGARANPTQSAGGTVPRSPDLLGSGNGTHDSAKVSATVCSRVDSVKKVPAKGTPGKDMDVGLTHWYDRSILVYKNPITNMRVLGLLWKL